MTKQDLKTLSVIIYRLEALQHCRLPAEVKDHLASAKRELMEAERLAVQNKEAGA